MFLVSSFLTISSTPQTEMQSQTCFCNSSKVPKDSFFLSFAKWFVMPGTVTYQGFTLLKWSRNRYTTTSPFTIHQRHLWLFSNQHNELSPNINLVFYCIEFFNKGIGSLTGIHHDTLCVSFWTKKMFLFFRHVPPRDETHHFVIQTLRSI